MSRLASSRPSPAMRQRARRLVLQALYQWHIAKTSPSIIAAEFMADNDMAKVDYDYFRELLDRIPHTTAELDQCVGEFIDRPIERLTPIECCILRMGAYELLHRVDVPYRVVINEGVELAKTFGAQDGHRYVNGVLDKMAQKVRLTETTAKPAPPVAPAPAED